MSRTDILRAAAIVTGLLLAGPVSAVTCEVMHFEGARYSVCEVNAETEEMRTFLYGRDREPYGQFGAINADLAHENRRLAVAMNGGMYHDDRSPVGHYVENGTQIMRVIANAGPGNFGMLPNGVFCIGSGWARVIETSRYLETDPACTYATQSGPMLVIDGKLHPRFLPGSTSRLLRNGIGTNDDGTRVWMAISDQPVTFYEFARFFQSGLNVPQALFLDGRVSRLYAPDLNRSDFGAWLGPIIGVVEPMPE